MRRFCLRTFCILLLIITLSTTVPVQAQTGPVVVRLSPNPLIVALDNSAELSIVVENVQDLYGIDLGLRFDPAVIEVLDSDPSQEGVQVGFGTFLEPGFVIGNQVDNTIGAVRFIMTQLSPATPKAGSGVLLVVRFKALALSENTPIDLVFARLSSHAGQQISSSLEDGSLSVVVSLNEPTPTAVPTQGAGTPFPTQEPATATQRAIDLMPPVDSPTPSPTLAFTATPFPTKTGSPSPAAEPSPTSVAQPEPSTAPSEPTAVQPGRLATSPTPIVGKTSPSENGLQTRVVVALSPQELSPSTLETPAKQKGSFSPAALAAASVLLVLSGAGGAYYFRRQAGRRGGK